MKTRKTLSLIMVISMLVALLTAPAMVTNAAETTVPGGARASQYVFKDTATFDSSNYNTNVWFQNSTSQSGFVDSGDGKALRLNDEIGNGWGGFMTKTALESYKVEGKVRTVLYSKQGAAAICARMNTDQGNRGLACAPNFANTAVVGGSMGKGTVYFTMTYIGKVNPTEGKMAVIIADKTTAASETFTFDLPQGVNFTNETAFEMVDNGRAIVLYCNDKFICSVDTASKVVNLYNGTQHAYTGEVNASGAFGVGGHVQAIYLDDMSLSYIKREIPELVRGEDFSSYNAGDFSTQGNWTVSGGGFEIVKNANGYNGNVLVLNAIKNQSQTAAFVLDSDKYLSAPFNVTTKFWDNGTPNGAIYGIDYTNGKQDFLASFIGGTNNGKFQFRAEVTGTRLQTTDAGISLTEGWHDFKVVADEKGVISYYVDEAPLTNNGAAIQLQLPEGVKVKGFTVRNGGWNSPDFTAYIPYVNFYKYNAVPGTYAVNFDLDGKGTAGETALVVVEGTVPTAPVVTANAGYIFKGWDKEIVAATENVSYTAQYEAIDYTVKFVADGEVISEEVYNYGDSVVIPEAPAKEGYTFTGWDADVVDVTGDATYTAVYEINKYTVKFVADGETVSEEVYEHGATVVVPAAPEKADCVFTGWTPEIVTTVTADAEYVAQYEAINYVAQVGAEKFETLGSAVEAAQEGDTVALLGDAAGAGVVIDKNITIDLGGYTYSFTDGVGSTGTESNGFQILKDNTVEIKNGTLNVNEADKAKFYILIQNYANLTITDVTLDGTNLDKWSATDGDSYVLSNNSGNVELNGETNIIANDEGDKAFAFDVCKYGSYVAPVVTVNTTGKIEGNIEVTAAIADNLTINNGIYTVDVSDYCADGFKAEQNADGTFGIVPFNPIATVNGDEFETLAEAVEAAQEGDTVVLLGDSTGAGVVIDEDITIDLGGYTYSFTDGVGSTGTESNGFQILKDNTVEIKNGTLNVNEADKAKFYMLIQNYANLTITDVTLDGTNLDKWSATDGDSYVLSNNSGNVELRGETNIIANDEGDKAFAFDVCKYGSYAAPVVTVNTTGKIAGNIEVTAAISDNLTINSGIYTIDVSDYCADGFTAEQNADGTYGIVEVEEETLPFKDILTTRVQSVNYDADKKQITLGLDRYKFNLASSTYGIALVPNDGETVEIAYNHDNGTAGVSTFKKFSSDKYNSLVTGVNAENGGGEYGKQPIYIIDRANGTRVYLDVTVTKADGAVETYTILARQDDLAKEGDVGITEILPLRADSESFVVDNEAKTIYFETTTANTSAGFAVAVDNGLNFTTRPRRLVTAKSGYKLAHGEIKDNADLQARFDRYVVARLSAGLEQTYQIKVHGGEDGLTYSWYTVTVKFNRVHEGDIEFSELLTKNADTCEFDNETNTINVTYSGESVAVAPVVVSGTRVYIENGIATTVDGVKAVAVKSENGAEQTAKLTLKIGNDTTEYTVNFSYVG